MRKTIEAVYERGVLRPLEPLDLKEGQRVQFEILTPRHRAEDVLRRGGARRRRSRTRRRG